LSYIATIGYFDGVHKGHQHLIQQLIQAGHLYDQPTLIITFDRHPRTVLSPAQTPALLSTQQEKLQLLQATGVDRIEVLHFDAAFAQLTAPDFMEEVLLKQLNVTTLMIGYDHHFGRPTPTCHTFEDYCKVGENIGIKVLSADEFSHEEHISSSVIRKALLSGDVEAAAAALGRPYTWTSRVVHGHHIGRTLGFPTANLALDTQKLLPGKGVYAVRANGLPAMLNIGTRPTLDNGNDISIEVHIFHCEADLYGQQLTLEFVAHLRSEQTFSDEQALAAQLEKDQKHALEIL